MISTMVSRGVLDSLVDVVCQLIGIIAVLCDTMIFRFDQRWTQETFDGEDDA